MLDGVNLYRAFSQSGGTLDGLNLIDIGVDEGLIGKIDAAEFEAVIFWGGFEGEGDFFSGVERSSFESGRASECLLAGHGSGKSKL
jgi:hypothetical protein